MRAWLLCCLAALGGCESTLAGVYGGFATRNAEYCEANPDCEARNPIDGKAWICDTLLHTCLPPDTCLSSEHSCQGAEKPICADGLCVPCSVDAPSGDAECQTRSEQRRDNRRVCIAGSCQECRATSDCPALRPVCAAQSCRSCREHAECGSGICRTDDSMREDAAAAIGTCVDEAVIGYVDADQQMSGSGTRQSPVSALADAVLLGRTFLSVRPSGNAYGALSVRNAKLIVVGQRIGNQTPVLTAVSVNTGSLVLSHVSVLPKNGQDGISCGSQAELGLRNVSVSGPSSAARGVVAESTCLRVDVQASRFINIQGHALALLPGSTSYRIVNSAFRNCGSTNPKYGSAAVLLGQGTRGVFTYNTLYQNLDAIDCGSSQRIDNSVAVGGAFPGCVLDSPDQEADLSPEQLQLQDTPRNHACCIDQAVPDSTVQSDVQGTPRPQGMGPDRGYWEG